MTIQSSFFFILQAKLNHDTAEIIRECHHDKQCHSCLLCTTVPVSWVIDLILPRGPSSHFLSTRSNKPQYLKSSLLTTKTLAQFHVIVLCALSFKMRWEAKVVLNKDRIQILLPLNPDAHLPLPTKMHKQAPSSTHSCYQTLENFSFPESQR